MMDWWIPTKNPKFTGVRFEWMEEEKATLRDNREVTLRLLQPDDRDRLLRLFSTMSAQALEWGMPPYTGDTIDRWLSNIEKSIPLVAVFDEKIVGFAAIYRHTHPRSRGVADFGIYVHQDFQSIGLGTIMSETVLSTAEKQGLHRVYLHVVEDNKAAVELYRKLGFAVEGIMQDAYYGADEKYHNLLVMGILLPVNGRRGP
jgi:putative acetyltransferase